MPQHNLQIPESEKNRGGLTNLDIIKYFVGSLVRDLKHGTQEIRFDLETARARMKKAQEALTGVRDVIDEIITDLQNAGDFPGKIEIMKRSIIGFLGEYGQQMLLYIGYKIKGISPEQMKTVIQQIFVNSADQERLQERLQNLVRQYTHEGCVLCPEQVIFSLPLVRYTESNRDSDVCITTIEQVLNNIRYTRSDISRGRTPDLITLFKQIISAYEVIKHFISFQPENHVEDEEERRKFQITHHMLISGCRRKIGEFWDEVYSLVRFLIFDSAPQENTNLQRRISQENNARVAQFEGLTIKIIPNYPPVVEITFDGETPITLTHPLRN